MHYVCFILTAKTVCELGKSRLTQAIVLAHPSSITVEDINGMNFKCLDYFSIRTFLI